MKAGPLTLPLVAASAVFFSIWGVIAATLLFRGAFGQSTVLLAVSLVSLIGWTQFLRTIKGESARWFFGIPLAVLCSLMVVQDGVAALSGIHPGQFGSYLLILLAPAAALAIFAFPEKYNLVMRGPLAVTALISIASGYLTCLLLERLTNPAIPVLTSGGYEVVGILYVAYLMPIVGILFLWLGVRCR